MGKDEKIKVLYLFDRYLNSTMNWAERWMQHLTGAKIFIAAPLIIKNEYYKPQYNFIKSPFQYTLPSSEKQVPRILNLLAKISFKLGSFQRFLDQKILRIEPDVIHIHFGNIAVKYLPLVKKWNLPLVVSFLGYDYEMVPGLSKSNTSFYKDLFEYGSAFTVGGPSGKKKLIELGCPPEKIKILSLGVNPEDIPFVPGKKPIEQCRLLQIGTITAKKGHLVTLEAFKIIQGKYPAITLTIIGEPADHALVESMEEFLVSNGITGVKLDLSIKPYKELAGIFQQHDIFLHPSVTPPSRDRETAPVVIMDAMLSGLPVVSTWHADIPEIVLDGETGILVIEGDANGLADAIERYITMPDNEFSKIQHEARTYIETNFSAKRSGVLLEELYREISKSG